jgi:AcrR family transcriptional regulator
LSTEEKILVAAKKVFLRDGFHGSRMDEIAREAGVNKALLHYYFRSKEKLFEVIFDEMKGNLLPRVMEIFSSDLPLFDKLQAFMESYIDMLSRNPYLPLFLINEVNKNPVRFIKRSGIVEKVHAFLPQFIEQLQSEVQQGNIKPAHPMHLIMNLMSMCIFPFLAKPMLREIGGLSDADFARLMQERKEEIVRFVLDALRA